MKKKKDVNDSINEMLVELRDDAARIPSGEVRAKYIESVAKLYEAHAKMKECKKDSHLRVFEAILRLLADVLKVSVPAFICAVLYLEGLKFEESGVFTSKMFAGLMTSVSRSLAPHL